MGCDYMNQYMCKAKRKDNGKWVCGYYVMKEDVIFKTKLHYILRQLEGDSLASWYPIDSDTLCRCTGVKDKNGNMIFEHDVVSIDDGVKNTFDIDDGEVVYRGGCFLVDCENCGTLSSLFCVVDFNYIFRGEIVGNIFDNT